MDSEKEIIIDNAKVKCRTPNGRFYEMAAVTRRNGSAILEVLPPPEVQWKLPLHKAASTLVVSVGIQRTEKGSAIKNYKINFLFIN